MTASGVFITLIATLGCGGDDGAVAPVTTVESAPGASVDQSEVSTSLAPENTATSTAQTTIESGAESTTTTTTTAATIPAPTIPAATTTVSPSGALVLYPDGIGTWKFGQDDAATVVPALATALSRPISDEVFTYPAIDGPTFYLDEFGEFGFAYPLGRLVCFDSGLCAEFGGATAPTVFVGWSQDEPIGGTALATIDGITVGSRWADFVGVMNVSAGGCYSAGTGTTRGIDLSVVSTGTLFGEFTADGRYIEALPNPNDVFVRLLSAGELRIALFADC
jgi:hypothetical protein